MTSFCTSGDSYLLSNISLRHFFFHRFELGTSLAPRTYSFFSLKRRSGPIKVTKAQPSPCTTRSLLTRCPRDVWERAGESLSVTSQLKVESSFLAQISSFMEKSKISWNLLQKILYVVFNLY